MPSFSFQPSKRARVTKESLGILNRVAAEMVAEKKAAVLALADGKVEKGDLLGRDLLTSLGEWSFSFLLSLFVLP